MTLNCARCHDHKNDPIPQTDYYRLVAFFQDVRQYSNDRDPRSAATLTDITSAAERATYEAEMRRRDIRKAELDKAMRSHRGRGDQEDAGRGPAGRPRAPTGRRSLRKLPQLT